MSGIGDDGAIPWTAAHAYWEGSAKDRGWDIESWCAGWLDAQRKVTELSNLLVQARAQLHLHHALGIPQVQCPLCETVDLTGT